MPDPGEPSESVPDPYRVAVVLVPNFSLMAYASTVEPLRAANRQSGRVLYRWRNYSTHGGVVTASNRLDVLTERLDPWVEPRPEMVVVCAGVGGELYRDRELEAALRQLARHGCLMVGVSMGSFILAHAGLLEGHRCTVHWEMLDAFTQAFPHLRVENRLYTIDRTRITCAGGTAAIDLMLELIGRHHGRALAARVADEFVHGQLREADDPQRLDVRYRHGIHHPQLIAAVRIMEETLSYPIPKTEIADRVGLSARQLERLFKQHFGLSPSRFYLRLRLERARRLLRQTPMPVTEVAFACGFETASHFAKCYREMFGVRPSEERRQLEEAYAPA